MVMHGVTLEQLAGRDDVRPVGDLAGSSSRFAVSTCRKRFAGFGSVAAKARNRRSAVLTTTATRGATVPRPFCSNSSTTTAVH